MKVATACHMNLMGRKSRRKLRGANRKHSMTGEMFPHTHIQRWGSECISGVFTNRGERALTGNRIYKAMWYHHSHHSEHQQQQIKSPQRGNLTASTHTANGEGRSKGGGGARGGVISHQGGSSTCSSRMACSFLVLLCR